MRAGWVVSLIGHVGFIIMTMLAWEARSTMTPAAGAIVPIEIVDVAEESNVRALAEDLPDEEVAASEETPTQEDPAPAPTPEPTPPRQRQNNDSFDLSAVAGLLDKQRDPGRERTEGQRADRTQRGAGLGTAEVAAMRDRVRSLAQRHLMRCWRMPLDQPEPERLVVTVEFDLDRNGNLRGPPRVTNPSGNLTFDPPMRVAADAARRAVTTCDPFPFATDPVVGEHYDTWSRLEFTFRPRS